MYLQVPTTGCCHEAGILPERERAGLRVRQKGIEREREREQGRERNKAGKKEKRRESRVESQRAE